MVKAVTVVSGDGAEIQSLLDGMFFGEIPGFEVGAVIAVERGSGALRRAEAAHVADGRVHCADLWCRVVASRTERPTPSAESP